MRAMLCQNFEAPESLTLTELDKPSPGAREVLLRTHAVGIGFVDALTVSGLYQIKPALPFVPGNELAGVVEAVGAEVTHIKPGQRVAAMGAQGGLAEFICINARNVFPLSDNLSFQAAASMLVNYCTALHGLDYCGNLRSGETVLVLGASGGVGMAAIDVALAMGATVVAAASSDAKRAACLAVGAQFTVDYTQPDWRKSLDELVGKQKVDVVYDPVGGDYAEPALRSIAPEGRFLVVGFAAGDIPKIPINLTLLKRCSIRGVNWGAHLSANPDASEKVLGQLMSWIEQNKLNPQAGEVYPLEQAGHAMRNMLDRKAIGKIVIEVQ